MGQRPGMYAQVTITKQYRECEEDVLATLQDLLRKRMDIHQCRWCNGFSMPSKMPGW